MLRRLAALTLALSAPVAACGEASPPTGGIFGSSPCTQLKACCPLLRDPAEAADKLTCEAISSKYTTSQDQQDCQASLTQLGARCASGNPVGQGGSAGASAGGSTSTGGASTGGTSAGGPSGGWSPGGAGTTGGGGWSAGGAAAGSPAGGSSASGAAGAPVGAACKGTCVHDACTEGAKLTSACAPCAATVCAADSFCCKSSWDDMCVTKAQTLCTCC